MSTDAIESGALELTEIRDGASGISEKQPSIQSTTIGENEEGDGERDESMFMDDQPDTQDQLGCCRNDRIYPAVLSVLVASIPALLFGCTLGFPSPVLLDLMKPHQEEYQFDTFLSDLFSAFGLVGGILGGPPAGWVADRCGRKLSVTLNGVMYAVGYTIIAFAKIPTLNPLGFKSILMLGRFITGVGSGWSFVSTPVYAAEISSPKLRGLLTSFAELSLAAGILVVYVLGSIDGFTYFEISLVILGIVVVFFVCVPWIPETPRWLLFKRNNKEKALKVLKRLRAPNYNDLHAELEGIQLVVESSGSLSAIQILKEFKKQSILVPFLILLVLMVFQELCGGGTTVATYAAIVFEEAGIDNPLLTSSYAIGVSQLIATIVSVSIIDCVGRKFLLIVSCCGMFAGSVMLGVHFFITRPSLCQNISVNISLEATDPTTLGATDSCNNQFAPLAIVSLIFFIMSFAVGIGPVLWALVSEYLPLHVRGFATSVVIVANWTSSVAVTGLYLSYASLVKPWFAWWTFSLINLFGLVFVVIFVVETKGKSLEDIQETMRDRFHFCSKRKSYKYHAVVDVRNGSDSSERAVNSNI